MFMTWFRTGNIPLDGYYVLIYSFYLDLSFGPNVHVVSCTSIL
jgi:hypothetical protein